VAAHVEDEYGNAFTCASTLGHIDILVILDFWDTALKTHTLSADTITNFIYSSFVKAAQSGAMEAVHPLLDRITAPDIIDEATKAAIIADHQEIARSLLQRGARVQDSLYDAVKQHSDPDRRERE
jgi:hypothetical protein